MFEIGGSLREARLKRELTPADVQKAIRIRDRYLQALEEERWEALPGDAYVKGFLRTYADYLGLDSDVYVDEYASRFITSWRDELPPRAERRRIRTRERPIQRRTVLFVLAGIALVAILVFAAFSIPGSSTHVPGVGGKHKQHRQSSGPLLVLQGVGRGTYVEVRHNKASGKVDLQGTVEVGQTDRLPGDHFYLLVRSPAGLHITLDGRPVSLPARHNLRIIVTPKRTTRLHG
jgi:cytoskeleton protein RodZ